MSEQAQVKVTLVANDADLVELIRYLSKYEPVRQFQLLSRAHDWLGLASAGGFSGADSAQMDLSPARETQRLSERR